MTKYIIWDYSKFTLKILNFVREKWQEIEITYIKKNIKIKKKKMEGEKKTENSLPDIKDILTNSEKDEKHDDTNQNNGRNSILKNENQNQNSGDLNS